MSITMTPQTSIRLVNVPFDSDEKHTLYFENKNSQLEYFNSLTGYSLSDYTYVKKDSLIKIGLNYELAKRYNYLYYTNYQQTISDQGLTSSPKTVFCYIVGMEYVNDNTTKLYIQTDNFQTYLTEILSDTNSISYIERQHVKKSDDIIGKHVIDEGLETGEYIVNKIEDETDFAHDIHTVNMPDPTLWIKTDHMIVFGLTSDRLLPRALAYKLNYYGGIYNGLVYVGFADPEEATKFIAYADKKGEGEDIYTVFMLPFSITDWHGLNLSIDDPYNEGSTTTLRYFEIRSDSFKLMDTLKANVSNAALFKNRGTTYREGYTAHNNKLYTSPYSYLMLSDNNGGTNIYKYEFFDNPNDCKINIRGTVSQGGSVLATPEDYKGRTDNYNESLDMVKFPTCSWTTDTYTNWLTQTAVSRANQRAYLDDKMAMSNIQGVAKYAAAIGTAIGGISGLVFGGPAGAAGGAKAGAAVGAGVIGAASTLFSQYGKGRDYDKAIADMEAAEYEHSLVSNSVKNSGATPEVNFSVGNFEYYLNSMSITADYAKKIDEYFDRFGYKVARNGNLYQAITSRSKWNYVKTVDCVLKADIPDENLNEIKAMFNNGITIWKNPNEIYRYDLGAQNV